MLAQIASAQAARTPARQVPPGSRIPVPAAIAPEEPESQRDAARMLQVFAGCAVTRNGPLFHELVMVPPLLPDPRILQAGFERARHDMAYCVYRGMTLGTKQAVMIGAFAEQFYRRRFDSLPPLGPPSVLPAPTADDIPLHETLVFANCLIDRDGRAVDALVRTRVGSGGERTAFRALSPHYANCLDVGSTIQLSRVALRSALSDQLYRRALAAPAPAPH